VPDTPSRRGRGPREGPQTSFGHGRDSERPALPRLAPRRPLPRNWHDLPPLGGDFWAAVEAGARALDVRLTPGSTGALDAQARLLRAWNEHINLTALRRPEQIARGHVLDSLSAVPLLRRLMDHRRRAAGTGRRLLDVGSGAGYPGLPLGLALPVSECVLIDSVRKKAAFLELVAGAAEGALTAAGEPTIRLTALARRAEDLAHDADHRAAADIVVARAVGSLAEVAELGLPLLAPAGLLVAWKRDPGGDSLRAEIDAARSVIRAAGGGQPQLNAADPSGQLGFPTHILVVVAKVRPTPDRYPRPAVERRRAALLR
jgi:16S rRNA (guanine527-N7)-methyltransferase